MATSIKMPLDVTFAGETFSESQLLKRVYKDVVVYIDIGHLTLFLFVRYL